MDISPGWLPKWYGSIELSIIDDRYYQISAIPAKAGMAEWRVAHAV
jgi:hypothetical protein